MHHRNANLQVNITDNMMKDIVENYKTGGSVKDLANYYKSCVALAIAFCLKICFLIGVGLCIPCDMHR